MRRLIIVIVLLMVTGLFLAIYSIEKYPANQLSLPQGYYKNSTVLDLFKYEDHLIYVIKNYEITFDAIDDDNCYDDMLIYAVTDLDGQVISTIEIGETLTEENDGDGIRSGEVRATSAQHEAYIYSSVSLYGDNFFIIFDSNNNTYEIIDSVYFYQDFIIDQHLKGVTLFDNEQIQIDYVEYSLSCELIDVTHIGYFNQGDQLDMMSHVHPLLVTDYIVLYGDLMNQTFGYHIISIYNINTEEIEVVTHSEDEYIDYWKEDNQIFYGKSSVYEGTIEIYDIESTFIEEKLENDIGRPSSNTFVDVSNTQEWFNNLVLLQDKDGNETVLSFKTKTYVRKIYEFGDDLYLVVRITPGFISQIVNGSHVEYVIHYKINEDNLLTTP